MDKNDEIYFLKKIDEYKKIMLKSIQKDIEDLLREGIDLAVYQAYTPSQYERTFALRNSVRSKIDGNKITVYVDTNSLNHYSVYNKNRNTSEATAYFIESGHSDNSGIDDQFHNYEPRYFLERCKQLIIQKYGNDFDIEIINEIPPHV